MKRKTKILEVKKIVTKIKNLVDWIHKQIQQEKKKISVLEENSEKSTQTKAQSEKKVRK